MPYNSRTDDHGQKDTNMHKHTKPKAGSLPLCLSLGTTLGMAGSSVEFLKPWQPAWEPHGDYQPQSTVLHGEPSLNKSTFWDESCYFCTA